MQIKSPEDVEKLPWKGNFRDDEPLFDLVNEYLRTEPDPYLAYKAERICNLLGMGIELPEEPSEEAIDYLREIYQNANDASEG